jgi:hypothetical protein
MSYRYFTRLKINLSSLSTPLRKQFDNGEFTYDVGLFSSFTGTMVQTDFENQQFDLTDGTSINRYWLHSRHSNWNNAQGEIAAAWIVKANKTVIWAAVARNMFLAESKGWNIANIQRIATASAQLIKGTPNQEVVTVNSSHLYGYKDLDALTKEELFLWIAIDKVLEQFGGMDIAAAAAVLSGQPFIPTRAKFGGATPGTSPASVVSRKFLNVNMSFRMPMITGKSLGTLRIAFTKNLGAFVGRTIPIVGWLMLAYDVEEIIRKTLTTYNEIAVEEDKLW